MPTLSNADQDIRAVSNLAKSSQEATPLHVREQEGEQEGQILHNTLTTYMYI